MNIIVSSGGGGGVRLRLSRFLTTTLLVAYLCAGFFALGANQQPTTLENCVCANGGSCEFDERGNFSHCECFDEWFGEVCELRKCAKHVDPCANGAVCEKTNESFFCHCPIGFKGRYCDVREPTICDSDPCSHGTCRSAGRGRNNYVCDCHYVYTGKNCTEIDHCAESECLNGRCQNEIAGHKCVCHRGWTGVDCADDIDECESEPCVRGECRNEPGGFHCDCPMDFVGKRCETPLHASLDPCLNGGQLALGSAYFENNFRCRCLDGFFGPRCEQRLDDCDRGKLPCVNGGVCIRSGFDETSGNWTEAHCKCLKGFTGELCEKDFNECEGFGAVGLCQNGATCFNEHGSFSCLCVGGFEGRHCERNIDDCRDNLCYAGSTCVDGISRYDCQCSLDRIGDLCEFKNPCHRNPCKNNGTCYAEPDATFSIYDYTCQCREGFQGRNCEHDVDECASPDTNRCSNGRCVNTPGSFRCECNNGYSDLYCSTLIRYCDSSPCQNGATCLNDVGRYQCICLQGYNGTNCEHRAYRDIYKCNLKCQNGGICRAPSDQRCECPAPYAGILCEIEKTDPCEMNKCAKESKCVPTQDYNSYTCQCPKNRAGMFCETELRPCEYNPCHYGNCREIPFASNSSIIATNQSFPAFVCDCHLGYTGALCDWPSLRCHGKPCLNGGSCMLHQNGDIECRCADGFDGPLCERKSSSANNNLTAPLSTCTKMKPCENKGRCVDLDAEAASFRCDCAPGWMGERCELNVDDCRGITCSNGGSCVDELNSYWCDCLRGFTGHHCEVRIPVDEYNGTDALDREQCRAMDCPALAGNGVCDAQCNRYACGFDGGDCAVQRPDPFKNCPQPSYCAHVFNNNHCDEICASEKCLFDGHDCIDKHPGRCPQLEYCELHYANGHCDPECNRKQCGWDGGDCETNSNTTIFVLDEELALVILVASREEFFQKLPKFLIRLSNYLRASLTLSKDEEGRFRVYAWNSTAGTGARIDLPEGMVDDESLSVMYDQVARKVKRNAEGSNDVVALQGVQIFVRLDTTMCHDVLQLQHTSSAHFSTSAHRVPICFSTVDRVADYLAAANSKIGLENLTGLSIYSAQLAKPRPSNDGPSNPWARVAGALFFVFVLGFVSLSVVKMQTRKRKTGCEFKGVETWIPPSPSQALKKTSYENFHLNMDAGTRHGISGSLGQLIENTARKPTSYLPNTEQQQASSHYVPAYSGHYFEPPPPSCNNGLNRQQHHWDFHAASDSHHSNSILSARNHSTSSSGVSSAAHSPPDQFPLPLQHGQLTTLQYFRNEKFDDTLPPLSKENLSFGVCQQDPSAAACKETQPYDLFQVPQFRTNEQFLLDNLKKLATRENINAQNSNGRTALIFAVICQLPRVVKFIVEELKADVNLEEFDGKSPLYHAVTAQNMEIVECLLNQDNINVNSVADWTKTPLIRCAQLHTDTSLKIAERLIAKSADLNHQGDNTSDKNRGWSALHEAASIEHLKMIELLIDAGADKNLLDNQGRTPLFVAVESGKAESVKRLLARGATKDKEDWEGVTPEVHARNRYFEGIANIIRDHVASADTESASACTSKRAMASASKGRGAKAGAKKPQQQQAPLPQRSSARSTPDTDEKEPTAKRAKTVSVATAAVGNEHDAANRQHNAALVSPPSACPSILTPPSSDKSGVFSATPSPNTVLHNHLPLPDNFVPALHQQQYYPQQYAPQQHLHFNQPLPPPSAHYQGYHQQQQHLVKVGSTYPGDDANTGSQHPLQQQPQHFFGRYQQDPSTIHILTNNQPSQFDRCPSNWH